MHSGAELLRKVMDVEEGANEVGPTDFVELNMVRPDQLRSLRHDLGAPTGRALKLS